MRTLGLDWDDSANHLGFLWGELRRIDVDYKTDPLIRDGDRCDWLIRFSRGVSADELGSILDLPTMKANFDPEPVSVP